MDQRRPQRTSFEVPAERISIFVLSGRSIYEDAHACSNAFCDAAIRGTGTSSPNQVQKPRAITTHIFHRSSSSTHHPVCLYTSSDISVADFSTAKPSSSALPCNWPLSITPLGRARSYWRNPATWTRQASYHSQESLLVYVGGLLSLCASFLLYYFELGYNKSRLLFLFHVSSISARLRICRLA